MNNEAVYFYTIIFLSLWLVAGGVYFSIYKPYKKGKMTSFVITYLMGIFASLISYLLLH